MSTYQPATYDVKKFQKSKNKKTTIVEIIFTTIFVLGKTFRCKITISSTNLIDYNVFEQEKNVCLDVSDCPPSVLYILIRGIDSYIRQKNTLQVNRAIKILHNRQVISEVLSKLNILEKKLPLNYT